MAQALDLTQSQTSSSVLDRLGIPRSLAMGFLGVLLFMIGDGVVELPSASFDRSNVEMAHMHRTVVGG